VHLFGRPAPDLSGLGVSVIEDAAQAFGAGGRPSRRFASALRGSLQ
jgi:dTDP-4-amino-4,6-dideoxygalactose transaminase